MTRRLFIIAIILCTAAACKKDPQPQTPESDNRWIYTQMKHYYLWTDQIPAIGETNLSLSAQAYYNSLRYNTTSIYGDRFSTIESTETATKSPVSAADKTYKTGYGIFGRVVYTQTLTYYYQVLSVVPGSPAEAKGIIRGDLFDRINDVAVTRQTSYTLPGSSVKVHKVAYNPSTSSLIDYGDITINAQSFLDTPIIFYKIEMVDGRKFGYLVYNHFSSGENNIFNNQLKSVFAEFKSAGVTDLILDLRYNGGGELSVVTLLSSMIAPADKVAARNVFSNLTYNATYGQELGKKYGEYNVTRLGLDGNDLVSCNLNLSKVYIIAQIYTASASEVTIHCLKPFMSVVQVGDTTIGKNLGSIAITDPSKKVKWKLHPIVCRITDSKNSNGYETGLLPDLIAGENYSTLGNWGDSQYEQLYGTIIYRITSNRQFSFPYSTTIRSETIKFIQPPIEDRGIIMPQ